MKSIFNVLFFVLLALLVSCGEGKEKGAEELPADLVNNPASADQNGTNSQMPAITFSKTEHDFGTLVMGDKVSFYFKFKNDGKSDLLLTTVKPDCGCTAAEYPRKPVGPGEEGSIKVTFDSNGKLGINNKRITVVTNAQPSTTVLKIKAIVEKK